MIHELTLTPEQIADCSHQGVCNADVEYWASRIPELLTIPADAIRSCLQGYGAWDSEELQDDEQNRRRLLWIAAGYCMDTGEHSFCVE